MRRGVKVLLVVLTGLIALLVLNAIAITHETKDAERNVEGAQLVDTSSGTLQVLDEGNPEGSPIVLIHGYTGSINWFEKMAPLLAQRHRVIRVDLLGHGGSEKPSAGYEISDQANAIAEALARLNVRGATVVGHSLGGTVATALAELSPRLATRVVILDQAPNDSFEQKSFGDRLLYAPLIGPALYRAGNIGPDSLERNQYEKAFAPGFNLASGFENPDQVVDDLREMTFTSFDKVLEGESNYSDARSLNDRLSAISVPLLVIFGAEDQIYDATAAIQRYEDIPGVRTEMISGVGHSPQVEAPEKTAALIDAFITRTDAAERAQRRAAAKAAAAARAKRKAKRAAKRAKAEAARQREERQGKQPAGR
jgi:pimeloyl-ACP methyl ester carboxylesterase